jgi:GNAT superfamily N-acetyltransferase
MSEIDLKELTTENVADVQTFIKKNWRSDHPIATNIDLFLWQYFGYGTAAGYKAFQIVYDDTKIIGFRAVIPLEIQTPTTISDRKLICYASAMWMIAPEYRGKGIGYKIHNNTEKISDSSLAIGANPNTSVPIYLKSGYIELKNLHRNIIPLSEDHVHLLINKDNLELNDQLFNFEEHENPKTISASTLEKIWRNSSSNLFALNRSEDYWEWRYLKSKGFEYVIFGDEERGIVVARIEKVINKESDDQQIKSNLKVLRIVEIIPANDSFWVTKTDTKLESLVKNVLGWGVVNNCCLADFFCSNLIFNEFLENIGFYYQTFDFSPAKNSHSSLFQPFERRIWNFNFYIRFEDESIRNQFNFNNSYFVRSDTDQDRPNLNLKN